MEQTKVPSVAVSMVLDVSAHVNGLTPSSTVGSQNLGSIGPRTVTSESGEGVGYVYLLTDALLFAFV